MSKECCVCQAPGAKYKCPTCRSLYCTAACCKVHKETPCAPQQPATAPPPQPSAPAPASVPIGLLSTPAPPATTELCCGPDSKNPLDPIHILSDAQLASLRTATKVRDALVDPAIRDLLTQVTVQYDSMVIELFMWMIGTVIQRLTRAIGTGRWQQRPHEGAGASHAEPQLRAVHVLRFRRGVSTPI